MKKLLITILFSTLFLLPIKVLGISSDYKDMIYDIVDSEVEEDKINVYLFHGAGCPHCRDEINWLKEMLPNYPLVNMYYYEVWDSEENANLKSKVMEKLNITEKGVPLTVIGSHYYVGYSDTVSSKIESDIKYYLYEEKNEDINIPFLGNVNIKSVSLPLVAIILGFIDGFNPCAMWILLFLINMLFRINNKKRAWILGLTFLFVSALVYFLSMLGINFIVGIATVSYLKIAIAIFILIAGILNFRKYFKIRKEEAGCSVVDDGKRKKLIKRIKNILDSKSFMFSLVGIIILAVSVNLIELACSLGFPLIFTEILAVNNIIGITRIIYLILYILFYMIDDIVVFSISMVALEATGITNKYNKLCTLVSSIIMIIMGLLLLFKPEWLMLNF